MIAIWLDGILNTTNSTARAKKSEAMFTLDSSSKSDFL
jgi:hypothetical protein